MIFETHAHYEDQKYNEDREELLTKTLLSGVHTIVNVGSTMDTTRESLVLSDKYERIYAAIGVHPSEIECLNEAEIEFLRTHAKDEKVVAIGEIGLDYYWDKDKDVQKAQRDAFVMQIEIAKENDLPIIIHSRDAAEDTMKIVKDTVGLNRKGVVHCYSYSLEQAREYIKMGYYIGVGGVVTFKNAKTLKKVVEEIPLERILLETDCPYMAPEPHRGSRNESMYLKYVVDTIAMLKNVTTEEVEEVTFKNACDLFYKVK